MWRKERVKLFDLFECPKEGEYFDREFYENQKNGSRDQEISEDLTKEYVDLVEEAAEAEEKQAAKVSRESVNVDQRVPFDNSDDAPNCSDSERSDPDFNVDPKEASQVSKNLDFSAASSSGSRTRRSNILIDPCIAEHPVVDDHSTVSTRSSRPRQGKCEKCDQILPQFKNFVQTKTSDIHPDILEQGKDIKKPTILCLK